jgi:hypothetical protein
MGRSVMNYVEGITHNGLPIIIADDDFVEHLLENGYEDSIEMDDLALEYLDWAKENVEA